MGIYRLVLSPQHALLHRVTVALGISAPSGGSRTTCLLRCQNMQVQSYQMCESVHTGNTDTYGSVVQL